jgi:hypothetical protein
MFRDEYTEREEYLKYLIMKKVVDKGYTIRKHRQWEGEPLYVIGKSLDEYILVYDERSFINAMNYLSEGKELKDFVNIGNDKVYMSAPENIFESYKNYFE